MREKKLYSSAIIPDDLYVQRDADRKLKEVLLRMSKPAYISVARQMGKTNLLIQTKRSLQNDTNKYIYIDLTNKFESSQDCFRYIINQIINSNEDVLEFQEASKNIQELRKVSKNNPTEEYQNEIREILKKYKGNLIVFLDEVDDLIKYNFSDDIFGQIRKTYFINETYPVLKRITYVLSGVIDPEKLIKTKENSPFNIAIPIYLEDFKLEEFYELIHKADLVLEHNIKEYLFNWLRGNPRMSFEILSLIEDEYISGKKITIELIDKIINDFYLTNFKNPPIDHIRDLIKHNTEVRKGLIKLKKGQIEELSDEIINKFYLFGITSSKASKQNLCIKNKVIELSLSDEWLEKIEIEKKGYYDLASDKIAQGEIEEGIKLLKEYIQNEPQGNFVHLANFDIGKAFYTIGQYEMSNKYLLEKPISKEAFPELYYWQIFYIGANFLKIGSLEDSLKYYDEIINECKIPKIVISAYANKGEAIINSKATLDIPYIENLYTTAIDYVNSHSSKIEAVEREKIYTLVNYRLGYIYINNKLPKEKALEFFKKSLETAVVNEKATLMLFIDSCLDSNSEQRKGIYKELTEFIIENNIIFSDEESAIAPFKQYHLLLSLSNIFEFELNTEFEKLFEYSISKIYKNELLDYELLLKVANFSINNNNSLVGERIINKILENKNINLETQIHCYRVLGLIYFNRKEKKIGASYLTKYADLFSITHELNEPLNNIDFNAFIYLIDYYREQKQYAKSFEISLIIERKFSENLNPDNKANSTVILFYIMDYYSFIGDITNVNKYGNAILNNIKEIKPVISELRYLDKKALEQIEKETISTLSDLKQVKQIEPIKVVREPGRNEFVKVKYKNGNIIVAKYKKVSDDIKKGECQIV